MPFQVCFYPGDFVSSHMDLLHLPTLYTVCPHFTIPINSYKHECFHLQTQIKSIKVIFILSTEIQLTAPILLHWHQILVSQGNLPSLNLIWCIVSSLPYSFFHRHYKNETGTGYGIQFSSTDMHLIIFIVYKCNTGFFPFNFSLCNNLLMGNSVIVL